MSTCWTLRKSTKGHIHGRSDGRQLRSRIAVQCSVRLQAGILWRREKFLTSGGHCKIIAAQFCPSGFDTNRRGKREKFLIATGPVLPSLREERAGPFQRQKRMMPCIDIVVNSLATRTDECESRFQDWLSILVRQKN